MKSPSAAPRGTTFVSPVTTATPAFFAAAASERTIRSSSSIGNPSSRMKPALRASGLPPHIARSLTVP